MKHDLKKFIQSRRSLYFQWDAGNWSQALDLWAPHFIGEPSKKCLEIGGWNGALSMMLADCGHQVLCSDLKSPEERATRLHREFVKNPELISYDSLSILDIPYESYFDLIVFKSVLGGIARDGQFHRSQVAIDQIHKALKPGGKLLFVENIRGSWAHQYARKRFRGWGDSWYYFKDQELIDLFSKGFHLQHRSFGLTGLLASYNPRINSYLSFLDQLLQPVVPRNWNYIFMGVATKK